MAPIARCFRESRNVALLRIGKAGVKTGQFLIIGNCLWGWVIDSPKDMCCLQQPEKRVFSIEKINLVRWIGKLDNPLNVTMQGIPESKTIVPLIKKLWRV